MSLHKKSLTIYVVFVGIFVLTNIYFGYRILSEKHVYTQNDVLSEVALLRGNTKTFKELSHFFSDLAEKKGGKYAFDVLRVADIPKGTDIHLLAHVVGDVLYRQEGMKGIRLCTDDFRNACSHTIVVGTLLEKGAGALGQIADICKQAPGGNGAYTMCFHGLGHGVLAFTNYNMEKAAELCATLGTKEYQNREYYECVGGMMMEMIGGVHNPTAWAKVKGQYFKEDDPLYPCTADFIPPVARHMCYMYITPHLFEAAGASLSNPGPEQFKEAFTFCSAAPRENEAQACYGAFGKEFIVLVQGRDIRAIEELTEKQLETVYDWCMLAPKESAKSACLESAIASMYWGGENSPDVILRFCAVQKTDAHKEFCYHELIGNVRMYIKNDEYRRSVCAKFPSEMREVCTSALL